LLDPHQHVYPYPGQRDRRDEVIRQPPSVCEVVHAGRGEVGQAAF